MKKFINKILENHSLIYKILLHIIATITIIYLFPKGGQFKYEFQKGKAWQYENYYAPFDFAIQKTTKEIESEKEKIKQEAISFFSYDTIIKNQVYSDFNLKFNQAFNKAEIANSELKNLENVSFKILNSIYEFGYLEEESNNIKENQFVSVRKGKELKDIKYNQFFIASELFKLIQKEIGQTPFTKNQNKLISLLSETIKPNVVFDDVLTQKSLNESLNSLILTTGFVSEKERIILRGDIVEGKKLAILNSLKAEFESQIWSKSNYTWIVVGYVILIALALLMLLLFIRKYREEVYENNTKVTFIFFNIVLIVFLVTIVVKYNPNFVYVVPLAILPLIIKAFFDARLGLFTHVLTVLLLGFIVPNSFEFIFLQIIAGIVTILTISELYKRANLFISVAQITLVYFITYFAFSIIQEGNIENLNWWNFGYFLINGVATLFVLPLIYIFEKLFGLISDESLKELSDTNSKLLRELSEKAPGTFNHSLQVANLAEASALEINANAMLVRTGALYHDIGKMENPMYFTENQTTHVNPHDELTPIDSAMIILNHVPKGVEIAKKHGLPDRIIDFIRTHHGTSFVYYFYKKELEINPDGINIKDFQYKGPNPFSKETAILMMCDANEAASKSLKEPSAQSIDSLVESIINKQMEDGQFMNADITFKEIQLVKKVIKKKLKNIYHLRIEYPE